MAFSLVSYSDTLIALIAWTASTHLRPLPSQLRLQDLSSALTSAGYNILSTIREYAVYDSNVALDAGCRRSN